MRRGTKSTNEYIKSRIPQLMDDLTKQLILMIKCGIIVLFKNLLGHTKCNQKIK